MAKRELAPNDVRSPYFVKVKEDICEEESGTRELGPLYPFIISGGTNTERFYFSHISDLTPYKFNIRPRYFVGESNYTEVFPKRIWEILNTNTDAKIFCVFDWDTIYKDTEVGILIKKHNEFLRQFSSEISNGILTMCPSIPSIEYWFLLHFEDYSGLLKNYSQISNRLAEYMKTCFPTPDKRLKKLLKSEKYLKDSTWVDNLCKDGKLELAIRRAENGVKRYENSININDYSYSYIYKLFQ